MWGAALASQMGLGSGARMAPLIHLWLLLLLLPGSEGQTPAPPGCGPDLDPIYYNLCDRSGAWGIVLEAVAGAGIVSSFVLTIILVASFPFVQDGRKRSLLGTQVFFLLGTLGLFCLVFACVVKPNFSTCASRRFLFGVLFGICFSCLVAHVFALNLLARKNHGPRGWVTFAVALLLAAVEVVINTEWMVITLVRGGGPAGHPGNDSGAGATSCDVANADFVMALIYVMLLLLVAFVGAWPPLCGGFKRWRKHSFFLLLTTTASIAIWVVWIVMYTYGNERRAGPTWDDPTLAIALAANAWTFLFFYVIPEVSQVTKSSPEQSYHGDGYPTRGVGYETILKEQKAQSMFVENKAFSMDEPSSAKKPVSPYSGYNGQMLTSVYQPTEMALMHKGPSEGPYDVILPRATANSQVLGSANSTLRAEDVFAAQSRQAPGPHKDKNLQVYTNPYVWD
ncbi:G-protein coupled receptor family C group 5 member C isoform X1 [Tachyglossus aculeatus]|uniref:G-protein coupled receptor family C group 5 member C isoform X1 n=1 Tax=Tachyglossus aculeatus TaxID=9261 RepID=UPI0018F66CB9|nr:G-protein coupled receptor family C group 5 member C isoform X1 [Tachyglossus aculeatus]